MFDMEALRIVPPEHDQKISTLFTQRFHESQRGHRKKSLVDVCEKLSEHPRLAQLLQQADTRESRKITKSKKRQSRSLPPPALHILCLDGGGTRAIATLAVLAYIELKTEKKICEMFDRIYGTSTGGIAGLLLAQGYPAGEVLDIYIDHMKDVFERTWWDVLRNPFGLFRPTYKTKGLNTMIKKYFEDKKLSEIATPISVVTADAKTRKAILLSSDRDGTKYNSVLTAARATSAAITYFPSQDVSVNGEIIKCVDGGIVANNPSLECYKDIKFRELHRISGNTRDKKVRRTIHILSLGTGEVEYKALPEKSGKLGFRHITQIPDYFLASASSNIHNTMQEIDAAKDYVEYVRINFALPKNIDLSDVSRHAETVLFDAAWNVISDDQSFNLYIRQRNKKV